MTEHGHKMVEQVATVLMGQSPPSSACSENGAGLPFIQGNAEFGERYPNPVLRCSAPTRIAEPGDLLLSVRAPVGELNQADQRVVIGRGLSAIRFSPDDEPYAWHAIKWAAGELDRVAQGSTFVAVSRKDVETLQIPWAPDTARSEIAVILDTIDTTIAKSQAVIDKLKHIRAGLLHDLLTRGLDHNGELRDPDRHPEQFKDSPLGRIPKEWDVVNVRQLANNCDARRVPVKQADRDQQEGIYPYYGASGVIDYVDDYLFEGSYVLVAEDGENLRSRQLPVAFIASGKFWVNNHAHILEPLPSTDVQFLEIILEYQNYQPWLIGSAQPKLTQKALEGIPLVMPSKIEQEYIAGEISKFQQRIDSESDELGKLQKLKSGLMSDLLTGRVRVPEDISLAAGVAS